MLYIYSGDVPELNTRISGQLGPKHIITTIPAELKDMASAKHVTDVLRHSGLRTRLCGARYYRDKKRLKNIIFNSDAIFLMGGNTFEFLHYAYESSLFSILENYENQGGVIMCDSAGSIILTPNIATALIPTTCPDEQNIDLDSYLGMNRIPFHISPHYEPDAPVAKNEIIELQALAHITNIPVMVLQDGEGLVMNNNEVVEKIGDPVILDPQKKPDPSINLQKLFPDWIYVTSPQNTVEMNYD